MTRRVFIAINLPPEVKEEIKAVQQKLKKFDWPVRWESESKWHLTLRFLGSITQEEVEQVKQIVSQSVKKVQPFTLTINNFIVFPSLKFPRVVCLKIDDSEPLFKLQKLIARAIEQAEIGEYERHPFSGHITIGRAKPVGANYRALTKMKFNEQFQVKSVEIMESVLKLEGSVYSVVESIMM